MRVIVVGLGVQGLKRRVFAGGDCCASVDPGNEDATYRNLQDVPLGDYDAAFLCVPDESKLQLLTYLVNEGKSALVEKPLLAGSDADLDRLEKIARAKGVIIYTAYNHKFEPHFVRMGNLVKSGDLGEIYNCRLFYGNGTARLVRDSEWRDQGAGVLPDLGSHMLDTVFHWFGYSVSKFRVVSANAFENKAADHVVICREGGLPRIEIELTLLMWRNHFTCDVLAEYGSAHIESLCKWGPSTFTQRNRVFPSGRPEEKYATLTQEDPTWAQEYEHFRQLVEGQVSCDLTNDKIINNALIQLSDEIVSGNTHGNG